MVLAVISRVEQMLFRTFALLSALPGTAAAWSFANFLQGDWDLERLKGDELIMLHEDAEFMQIGLDKIRTRLY